MSQKSSVPQAVSFVSQVLKRHMEVESGVERPSEVCEEVSMAGS